MHIRNRLEKVTSRKLFLVGGFVLLLRLLVGILLIGRELYPFGIMNKIILGTLYGVGILPISAGIFLKIWRFGRQRTQTIMSFLFFGLLVWTTCISREIILLAVCLSVVVFGVLFRIWQKQVLFYKILAEVFAITMIITVSSLLFGISWMLKSDEKYYVLHVEGDVFPDTLMACEYSFKGVEANIGLYLPKNKYLIEQFSIPVNGLYPKYFPIRENTYKVIYKEEQQILVFDYQKNKNGDYESVIVELPSKMHVNYKNGKILRIIKGNL